MYRWTIRYLFCSRYRSRHIRVNELRLCTVVTHPFSCVCLNFWECRWTFIDFAFAILCTVRFFGKFQAMPVWMILSERKLLMCKADWKRKATQAPGVNIGLNLLRRDEDPGLSINGIVDDKWKPYWCSKSNGIPWSYCYSVCVVRSITFSWFASVIR